jgi:cytidyltransferase-like protein
MKKDIQHSIVYTQGVWDMFHIGHLNLLRAAKSIGSKLIVGVNTDDLVLEYKGHQPLLCWEDRAEVVRACKYVDVVMPADSLEKDDLLHRLDADILVHGDDKRILGSDWMEANGRRVISFPYTAGRSSSLLRDALERYYDDLRAL